MISLPTAVLTGVTQVRIAAPLTIAVQAPHCPSPQPNFGPRSSDLVAQYIEKRRGRIDIDGMALAVDLECECHINLRLWPPIVGVKLANVLFMH